MQIARIVVVAALVGLVACSSGLSKDEFIEQADKLCAEADEKTQGLEPPRTPEALADFVAQAQAVTGQLLEDLRELDPPEEDREVIESMLSSIEEVAEALPQIQEAAEERDLQEVQRLGRELQASAAEANRIAQEYGLKTCGRSQPAPVP